VKADLAIHRLTLRVQNAYSRLGFTRKPREHIRVEEPAQSTVDHFRRFARFSAVVAMVVGYHVILGWMFNIDVLKRPWPTFTEMKLNSAVCAILAGVALLNIQKGRASISRRRQRMIEACALIILAISLIGLAARMFGLDLAGQIAPQVLGTVGMDGCLRMGVLAAFSYLLIGMSLLLLDGFRTHRTAELLALISTGLSLFAIAGYVYQADTFQRQMSLYTSVVIFLLSGGILCARSERGLMARITSNSFGGIMARRLLPAALMIPVVLGWLQHLGHRAGLYTSEPGLALLTITNVVVFIFLIWWGVNSLHRMDTKRRQAERELQETAAKLSRSNADLEQFAYVASHDLKEPLRAISGSVQILQERYQTQLGADAEQVIRHTVEGALRMQRLIDDLLTYSRLATREAPLEPADCSAIVQEVLANLAQSIQESKAVVTHDPLPTVAGDRTQLLQVFQNLISNGIKYRSQRTPKIHIGVEDRDGEWLFSVRDNGIGIAPQYAERIFRIFQRLHTRKEYSGTGIGLAVCKKIIERHGGKIWIESEPEEGSTFFFTLPKA
jgi:signal transduction histidine kinase